MANALEQIETIEVSLVPQGANGKRFILRKEDDVKGEKAKEGKAQVDKKEAARLALEALSKAGEVPEALVIAMKVFSGEKEHTVETKETKVETKEAVTEDAVKAIVEKAQAEATIKARAEVEKQLKDERDARAVLEKQLKEEKDARLTREYVEKARIYKNLSVKPEEFGLVLKAVKEGAPTAYEAIEKLFGELDSRIGKMASITKEIGVEGGGESSGGDAEGKLVVLAKDLRSKDTKLTFEQAYAKVTEMHPELMSEAKKDHDARIFAARSGGARA